MGKVRSLRHGSLFSGLGGFDLAAEWCGWDNIFHCEINEFCNRILNYYWPQAVSIKNIVDYEWKKWKGKIDVLSGGFPCQPYSLAGKRLGKEDERHLWPGMLRAIREIRPLWVVAENVLGIISWNNGVVFEEVQSDLEAEGYAVQPYVLPAAGVDAPHRRDRVWFVAYRTGIGWHKERRKSEGAIKDKSIGTDVFSEPDRSRKIRSAADANHRQQQKQQESGTENRQGAPTSRSGLRAGAGAGDSNREIAERIQRLDAGAGFLQETAAHSAGFGCDNGRDNRQKRPFQSNQRSAEEDQPERQKRQRRTGEADTFPANPDMQGLERQTGGRIQTGTRGGDQIPDEQLTWFGGIEAWENFPQTQPSIRIGDDGLPGQLDLNTLFEGIPFPVKPISFSKWRTESIKALGNAIVPQVAWQIFKAIDAFMNSVQKQGS